MTNREVIYVVRPNITKAVTAFPYMIVKTTRYDTGHVSEHVVDYAVSELKANNLAEAYNRNGED